MITCGFYDSLNGDRRYGSISFGSIFDGVVREGVFMSIGTCLQVTAGNGMGIIVGAGRAWFNKTWTLNDAPYPMELSKSEVLLGRIDAVILEVNQTRSVRNNTIKIIQGAASGNPTRPALKKSGGIYQYPLAYISVGAGVTSIRTADITNMVGTSETPFVTGILETINIDSLIAQWGDQWREFYEFQTNEILTTNQIWKNQWDDYYKAKTKEINNAFDSWTNQWNTWYDKQTKEIQDAYAGWESEWNTWFSTYQKTMEDTAAQWNKTWNDWYKEFTKESEQWRTEQEKEFTDWVDGLHDLLDADTVGTLVIQVQDLQKRVAKLEEFKESLLKEHAIYDPIKDSNSEKIVDNNGNEIEGVTKFDLTVL